MDKRYGEQSRPPLTPTTEPKQHAKIERALQVRKGAAAARKGKPMAFPTHRMSR